MKQTTEQFRVPGGSWHQTVRSNWVKWIVGACLVNLDTRVVEMRTTTEEPTCDRCVQALEKHPELHTGREEPAATPTPRQGSARRSTKSGDTTPKTEATPKKRGTGDVSNDAPKAPGKPKKQKVRKEPQSPTLF